MASGSSAIFACTNCHGRHPFHELSSDQQLCRSCRERHPLVSCIFCRLEFHLLKKTNGGSVCKRCSDSLKVHGPPKNCLHCHIRSAFKGSRCASCTKSEKKYGSPVVCEQCKVKCAFARSEESRSKVDGKILCLLCTLHFKKHQHRKRKKERNNNKRRHHQHDDKKQRKTESSDYQAANDMKSRLAAVESASNHRSASNSPMLFGLQSILNDSLSNDPVVETPPDTTLVDQIAEIASLKDQVAALKKQLLQKDKTILEKDRKIHELEAAKWEHGKELREKTKRIEKEYTEIASNLRDENRSLKKQLSQASKQSKVVKSEIPS